MKEILNPVLTKVDLDMNIKPEIQILNAYKGLYGPHFLC